MHQVQRSSPVIPHDRTKPLGCAVAEPRAWVPTHAPSRIPVRWQTPAAIVVILIAGALAHGWALFDGLFLDDHLHLLRYQEPGWSWDWLLNATTVKPDEFIESWWQTRTIEWHYTRPVAILAAKLVYRLSGGSPIALHALSLALHLGTSILVYYLALGLTRRTGWSLVAALLFVVYSHSVYAVAWLASQNSVMQTFFTVAAMMAYIRASGIELYAAPRSEPWSSRVPSLRVGWFAAFLVLWVLGLLSRESAIVLPAILAGLDLAFHGGRGVRARLAAYAVIAGVGLGFCYFRLVTNYWPMPDFYVRRYDGPAYICWWITKLLHFVTAAVWLSPMTVGPTARINPFTEVPLDVLLMVAILAVMGGGYLAATRRARGWWLWPLWIVLTFLPVVPLMAAPHSGYMAGVGFAIAMVLGAALRPQLAPTGVGRWSKPVAIWFLIATCTYIPIYRTMWYSMHAAERMTIAGVAAAPPGPETTDIFFINLPFVNVYAGLHAREVLPDLSPDVRVHALTHAPNLLRVESPCEVEQLDGYSFRVSTEGRPYFSGALGRYLIEAMRPEGRLREGERISAEHFDVQITRADEEGVRELVFTFKAPLADSRYAFYLTTNQCGATRVKFQEPAALASAADAPARTTLVSSAAIATPEELTAAVADLQAGKAAAADVLFQVMIAGDRTSRAQVEPALREVVESAARALASPVLATLVSPGPDGTDWSRVRAWWKAHVDDDVLRGSWGLRHDMAAFADQRDALFRIRERAARIIRTDLYLTGPAHPSPR